MKYYIKSGDLETIISTNRSPILAAKYALEQFMTEYSGCDDKSVCPIISVSERGFRDPESRNAKNNSDTTYFDITEIIDTQI